MKPAAPAIELACQAILPFHLGSSRSSSVFGAWARGTMSVLIPVPNT